MTIATPTGIQQLQLAYFGRPSDPAALTAWPATGLSIEDIVLQLVRSAEYQRNTVDPNHTPIAGGGRTWNDTNLINTFYLRLFGRLAVGDEVAGWSSALARGAVNYDYLGLTILNAGLNLPTTGAAGEMRAVLVAKVRSNDEYTSVLRSNPASAAAYSTAAAIQDGIAYSSVTTTSTPQTLVQAQAAVATMATSSGAGGGQAFTLTTSQFNYQGGGGNDTFVGLNTAAATNFSSLNTINGAGGVNTLKVSLNADYAGGAQISNIQNIELLGDNGVGSALIFNTIGIAGLQLLTSSSGDANGSSFTSIAGLANFAVSNQNSNATFVYLDSAVAGAADSTTLTLNNIAQTALATVAINNTTATTGNTGLETLNVVLSGAVGTAANTTTLTTNATASLQNLIFTGSAVSNITLGANVQNAVSINASAATGALTIAGFGAVNTNLIGGTGSDTFNFAANLTLLDSVDGGSGTDTLGANGAQLAAITAAVAGIKNIETLRLQDDIAATATVINASNFGTVSNFRVEDQGNAGVAVFTVNNLTAAATSSSNNLRFDGDLGASGGSFTFNITGASDPGTANSVTLDLRGAATTATSAIVIQGVETVAISTANATGLQTFTLTDANLQSLTMSGVQGVTFGAALGGNVSSVNASGITGAAGVGFALSATAATGANIVGSAQVDAITGSNLRDIINTGGGNDTVNSSGGLDTVTFGAGNDVLRVNSIPTAVTAANMISVTDFIVGEDTINIIRGVEAVLLGVTVTAATTARALATPLSSTTAVNSVTDVYTQLGNVLTAANFALSAPAAGANQIQSQVVTFTSGSSAGSYLVVNDATAGFSAVNDLVINITGSTGTFAAASFTFTA